MSLRIPASLYEAFTHRPAPPAPAPGAEADAAKHAGPQLVMGEADTDRYYRHGMHFHTDTVKGG